MSDTPDWLVAARARCEAATPGPWVPHCDHEDSLAWLCNDKDFAQILGGEERREVASFVVARTDAERDNLTIDPADKAVVSADVSFIAAARTDLPRALAAVEAADALAAATDALETERARCHSAMRNERKLGCRCNELHAIRDEALAAYRAARGAP